MSQIDAYRQATGSKAKAGSMYVEACKWAKRPHVRLRIQELVNAVKQDATGKLVYRWEEAMAELQRAQTMAALDSEHSSVLGAIRQKCRISGLEVDPRQNKIQPFEGVTDDELDDQIRKAEAEVRRLRATH